ncbi:MAG: hypothetical protein JXB39_03535 [Deltaproteobacteria bacterium]|nr:hypothetical protein [Deltaproteobacteria bacterium]
MKPLLLGLLLAAGVAGAGPSVPLPWVGIPLARLPELGVGVPMLSTEISGWKAPLQAGGFVRVWILPDEAVASAEFAFQQGAVSSRGLPPLAGLPEAEAAGDGAGILLVRDRNVLILVRDPEDQALEVAGRLRAALVTSAPEGTADERTMGDRVWVWDSCGRLTVTP